LILDEFRHRTLPVEIHATELFTGERMVSPSSIPMIFLDEKPIE
jgi:hypothetical protein